jgi:ATP-dependent Lon protease
VILPRDNEHDLAELPQESRDRLEFVLVESLSEVIAVALRSSGNCGTAARRVVQPTGSRE